MNKGNFFDESIGEEAEKEFFKTPLARRHDNDEEDEVCNWNGTPVVKYDKSKDTDSTKPPIPDMSNLATPSLPRTTPTPLPSMSRSSSTYGGYEKAAAYSDNSSHSFTMEQRSKQDVNEKRRYNATREIPENKSASIQSLDSNASSASSFHDIIDDVTSSKRQPTSSDMEKMHRQIKSLKEELKRTKKERWMAMPIENTLVRMIRGEAYSLEMYRCLSEKLELVDKAVKVHDGNAVTAATLFLKNTTSAQIFSRELRKRPEAADHYLHYLKEHYDFEEYIHTLRLFGRNEEAAIFRFKLALPTPDVSSKITKLGGSLREGFSADPSLSYDKSLVQEYIDLLERQRPIEESDAKLEASGQNQIFKDFPRKRSLVDVPVVTTLYYCSLYHFDLAENSFGSPQAIRQKHRISEKQYVWTAVRARAKLRRWKDIEAILMTKGWFGGTKLKAVIGFDKIVGILHRNNAPPDILAKYIAMMDDSSQRLSLAKKIQCHKAVIDTYAHLKDRSSLETYAAGLDRYSKDGLYAYDVLNGSVIKWK